MGLSGSGIEHLAVATLDRLSKLLVSVSRLKGTSLTSLSLDVYG